MADSAVLTLGNNAVERAILLPATGRNSSLFIGSPVAGNKQQSH